MRLASAITASCLLLPGYAAADRLVLQSCFDNLADITSLAKDNPAPNATRQNGPWPV